MSFWAQNTFLIVSGSNRMDEVTRKPLIVANRQPISYHGRIPHILWKVLGIQYSINGYVGFWGMDTLGFA